jgi:hypothetical protein
MFRLLALVTIVSLSSVGAAYAQTAEAPFTTALTREIARADWAQSRDAIGSTSPLTHEGLIIPKLDQRDELTRMPVAAAQAPSRERSWGWKVLGGAIGGVGGLFAGGYIGAALEPDCHCDDPGLIGALIGAPIGAAVGATLGVILF